MEIDYSKIPAKHMVDGMKRYLEHGIEPGDFMIALLCNDLTGAVNRADGTNIRLLPEWVRFMFNDIPSNAWGSVHTYQNWVGQTQKEREVILYGESPPPSNRFKNLEIK